MLFRSIQARGKSSAASAASAAWSHARTFTFGTDGDDWTSAAVCSDGSYGVPEGLISSFPVRVTPGGEWEIVQGLEIDDYCRAKIDSSVAELESEKEIVADLLG